MTTTRPPDARAAPSVGSAGLVNIKTLFPDQGETTHWRRDGTVGARRTARGWVLVDAYGTTTTRAGTEQEIVAFVGRMHADSVQSREWWTHWEARS